MRRILAVAALAAVFVFTPGAAAQAAPGGCHRVHQQNGDNVGLLNGTQVYAPLDLGLNFTGNALALLGYADADGVAYEQNDCGN